jgi:serine/threonine-protein kinase
MTTAIDRLTSALAEHYRIERELGQGGMATVYLAEDLKHKRRVAVKVLRPDLAAVLGGERFVQEITTTASLQHPHILPLFDSGSADGFLYYVMPFIDGETLRSKLNRETQLGIEEAVGITVSIADALDYAHRHGIIHRDIKPENILLHDGRPMVADFGIALAVSAAAGGRMTETGLSLGTPHYMSPEQATAEKELTSRSDIYSLGAVLYEMLSGSPPHVGASAQQIIVKIVTDDARPVTELRKSVPPQAAAALAKALERVPADRFASAHDFAEALQGRGAPLTGVATVALRATRGQRHETVSWRARLRDPLLVGTALFAAAAVAAAAALARRPAAPAALPIRFVLAASDSTRPIERFPWPAAISPDGGTLVYSVARRPTGTTLFMLHTDQLEAHPIPGTTDAYQPYFSPDGGWLAFEASGKERKVRLDGSAPVSIADAAGANGADWTAANEIVLGAQGRFHGLSHVSAAGGEPVALTHPDSGRREYDHLWPIGTPDGGAIVFAIWSGSLATSRLAMVSSGGGAITRLGISGIRPLAVLDNLLVYLQADGAVMAIELDARHGRVNGRPIPVHDPVPVTAAVNGNSGIFISRGGAMVTSRGGALGVLAWLTRDGRAQPVSPEPRAYAYARLSPDERRIAVVLDQSQKRDVWIYDLALGTFSRLTSNGAVNSVEWSGDGSRVVFAAAAGESLATVWSQPAAGGTPPTRLFEEAAPTALGVVSPDGKSLVVNVIPGNSWDILRVSLDSQHVASSYLATDANEHAPQFSPDGRWVALVSDESGQDEVYVRSFPDPASKTQISVGGGSEPVWSGDGTHLYYRSGEGLLSARVSLSPGFALLGRDTVAASMSVVRTSAFGYFSGSYQPTRDGKRILAILADRDDYQLVVSPNWTAELRRRVAESRSGR